MSAAQLKLAILVQRLEKKAKKAVADQLLFSDLK